MSTLGEQRRTNYALQFPDADSFVAAVTEGQPEAPGYFAFDATRNKEDRTTLDEHTPPVRLSVVRLVEERDRGTQIVDTRDSQYFATGHLIGSINVGLGGRYAEYAGSVVRPDEDVVVVVDSGGELEAKIRLARIGYDRVIGWFPAEYLADIPSELGRASRLTPAEFIERQRSVPGLQVVDVRNDAEWRVNHLDGAVHIPVGQLRRRLAELETRAPTVVYCAGGYRSSIAASILRANAFSDVSDVLGGFEAVLRAG